MFTSTWIYRLLLGKLIQLASANITPSAGRLTNHLYQFVKKHCCCLSHIWPNKIYPMQRYKCTSLRYNTVTPQLVNLLYTLRTPRLNYVLKDIRKTCSMNHQPREWEPITFQIMERLHTVLSKHSGNYKDIMIWAACCLAYFGFLRVSEFTTSSPDYFDSSTDLLLSDVALDNRVSSTTIQIILKQSKNDQFRAGITICLGKTTHAVCPVDTLIQYLAIRGGTPGPLFLLPNNQSLTGASFRSALKKAFQELHMDHRRFNTHSFRTGVATSAKHVGMSDSHLKALGRWRSDAYLKYVRLSPKDLARLSKSLASS